MNTLVKAQIAWTETSETLNNDKKFQDTQVSMGLKLTVEMLEQ